jgi:hypothetical protein
MVDEDAAWARIDGQLAAKETRPTRRSVAVNYPPELYPFVLEAAKLRGLSMQAYQRRAALAFAQADLGFDWLREMDAEPQVGSFVNPGRGTDARGRGYGSWQILDLGSYGDV